MIFQGGILLGQQDTVQSYKKRVLETTEVDILTSFYSQDGTHAAVSGGIGTENLSDITPTVVVSVPLNADDILTVDAGISAYTSASSSNVDPFTSEHEADPFQASTGASSGDLWISTTIGYSHSSDDRNHIWSGKISLSTEYDYNSLGFGGGYTRLFNHKNTELGVHANIYLDSWKAIYPVELRPFEEGRSGLQDGFFGNKVITGNADYQPTNFSTFDSQTRNSYSLGLSFAQILSKKAQASVNLDLVQQQGLLSTPFQRVYFKDIEDSFVQQFHLADDIERLPSSRSKAALGGRLNYYLNELVVLRSYYRFYIDDWGVNSHTASLEVPVKLGMKFTVYPSYRFYNQTAADYFAPYEEHLSTEQYYTSDYDLSPFIAHQLGMGVNYTDIFSSFHLWHFGLKSIDLKFNHYQRNTDLTANIIALGFKFVMD